LAQAASCNCLNLSCTHSKLLIMGLCRALCSILALVTAASWYFVVNHSPLTGIVPLAHVGIPWGYTEAEIPDLTGKVALVTGANVGLGRGTAQLLAKHNAEVHITCRSQSKCDQALEDVQASIPENGKGKVFCSVMELSSLTSVHSWLTQFKPPTLDILILNAGVMACPYKLSEDGIEWQFAVNHVAHFLLAKGVLPRVEAAAAATGDARVVAVSSGGHFSAPSYGIALSLEGVNNQDLYHPLEAYGQSKLANLLFAKELQRRMDKAGKNVYANAVHPGGVQGNLIKGTGLYEAIANNIGRGVADSINDFILRFYWSEQDAALTSLYAATSPAVPMGVKGKYLIPIARQWKPSDHAENVTLGRQLWDFSEKVLKEKGFNL